MSGSAGSKYGIINDGVPTTARDSVTQKLEPLISNRPLMPSERRFMLAHSAYVNCFNPSDTVVKEFDEAKAAFEKELDDYLKSDL